VALVVDDCVYNRFLYFTIVTLLQNICLSVYLCLKGSNTVILIPHCQPYLTYLTLSFHDKDNLDIFSDEYVRGLQSSLIRIVIFEHQQDN